jgi:hypothetical protein
MEHQEMHTQGEPGQRSLKEILTDLVRDVESIFRKELRLAAVEVKAKFQEAALASGLLAAAGVLGFFAMACFVAASIVALNILLPLWFCCVILGVLLAVGAGGGFLAGRMLLQEVDLVPQKTAETLKENLEWAKSQAGAARSGEKR